MKRYARVLGPVAGFLAVGFLSLVPTIRAAQPSGDSKEVSSILADAKTEAVQLKQDAEEMNSFVHSGLSWQTHAAQLDQIKQHINSTGEIVAKLNNARNAASPWQQATDRITPLLKELAASVETTITFLGHNQERLVTAPYTEYVQANTDFTVDLSQVISDYVAYSEAKHKSEELARKLEVPTS
jgi:ABC-type transporter Mla subunit MlaD